MTESYNYMVSNTATGEEFFPVGRVDVFKLTHAERDYLAEGHGDERTVRLINQVMAEGRMKTIELPKLFD